MQRLFPVVGMTLSIFWGALAQAQAVRVISTDAAQGQGELVTIALYPAHSVTLNFRSTGETMRKVWLDEPSQVTLDFDDANCLSTETKAACAASVIHLRRIRRLPFPDLPVTQATTLTVLSDRALYKFRLTFPTAGSPTYEVLEMQAAQANLRSPTVKALQSSRQSETQLIERGLQVAAARNLIRQGDALWQRLQALLRLLRDGWQMTAAARQIGVSPALLKRLVEMGLQASPL